MRKDFTPSERVEIGRALEGELAQRHGRNQHEKEDVENFPRPPEGRSRDLAAKAAGFGNGKTYEQAKAVVDSGVPELVESMDAGTVSVSAAAAVAGMTKQAINQHLSRAGTTGRRRRKAGLARISTFSRQGKLSSLLIQQRSLRTSMA